LPGGGRVFRLFSGDQQGDNTVAKIVLSGSDSIDLSEPDLTDLYAESVSIFHDNSVAVIATGDSHLVFQGSGFTTFDNRGYPTSGTVNKFSVVFGPDAQADWSGLDFAAVDMETAIKDGDTATFIDLLFGGNDKITLNGGGATINGFDGNDKIVGKGGADFIIGGDGNDVMKGGGNEDLIAGQLGKDKLVGGDAIDVFIFDDVAESTAGGIDTIKDLDNSDFIYLLNIDADENTAGNQGFTVVASFSNTAGEMTITFNADKNRTEFQGDVDGDGAGDLVFFAKGDHDDFTNFSV
jgi:hypothetical protein